ncbi:MAG: hypothetical protein WDW36_008172 [Sanguina aurantia]
MSLRGSGSSRDGTTAVMFDLSFLTYDGAYIRVNPSFRSTVTTTAFDGSIAVAVITEVTTAGDHRGNGYSTEEPIAGNTAGFVNTLALTDSGGRAYRLTNQARLFQSTLRLGVRGDVPQGGVRTHLDASYGAYTYFDCTFSSAPMGDVAPTPASILGEFDYQYSPEAEEAITDYTTPDFHTGLSEGGDAPATALVTAAPSQAVYGWAARDTLGSAPASEPTALAADPVTADAIRHSLDYQPSDLRTAFIQSDNHSTTLPTAGPEAGPSPSGVMVATYDAVTGAVVSDLTTLLTDAATAPTDTTSAAAGDSLDQALVSLDTAISASAAPISLLNTALNEINSNPHSTTLVHLSTSLTTLQQTLDNLKSIMDAKNATRPTPYATLSSSLRHTLSDTHTTMFETLTLLTITAASLGSGFSGLGSSPSARTAAHFAAVSTLKGILYTLGDILVLLPREMLGDFGSLDPAVRNPSAVKEGPNIMLQQGGNSIDASFPA